MFEIAEQAQQERLHLILDTAGLSKAFINCMTRSYNSRYFSSPGYSADEQRLNLL